MDFQVFNLNLAERFGLLDLLPSEGNFLTLGLIVDFKKELVPGEEEIEAFGIVEEAGRVTWDVTKDIGKDFKVGPKLFEVIYRALDQAERGSQLKSQHYTLFQKIALPKREAEEAEQKK
jgi:hypothetical protein